MQRRFVHPHFQPMYDEWHRYILARGGRHSAKSHEIAQMIESRMAKRRGYRALVIRQFQNSLKESCFELIKEVAEASPRAGYYRIYADKIVNTKTKAVCIFKGIDRHPMSIKSYVSVNDVWVEEASEVSKLSFDTLLPTLRTEGHQFIFSWNPQFPENAVESYWKNKDIDALRVECHWTQLREDFRVDVPEKIRDTLPADRAHVWDGEYRSLAEQSPFLEDAIIRAFGTTPPPPGTEGCGLYRFAGVDLAWTEDGDATAVVVLDEHGNKLAVESFRESDPERIVEKLVDLTWGCYTVVVDTTGGGRPIFNLLTKQRPATEFPFTTERKAALVRGFNMAMGDGRLKLGGADELEGQVRRFVRQGKGFGAAAGHDDLVCAAMLAGRAAGLYTT